MNRFLFFFFLAFIFLVFARKSLENGGGGEYERTNAINKKFSASKKDDGVG